MKRMINIKIFLDMKEIEKELTYTKGTPVLQPRRDNFQMYNIHKSKLRYQKKKRKTCIGQAILPAIRLNDLTIIEI